MFKSIDVDGVIGYGLGCHNKDFWLPSEVSPELEVSKVSTCSSRRSLRMQQLMGYMRFDEQLGISY